MVSRYFFFFAILFSVIATPAFATDITVTADRNPVHVNESFQLIFEANGSVDDDPDFTPLQKNFEILQQNQASNFSMVNGTTTRSKKWTLMVMAQKDGVLTIPAISFGKDRSPASAITVNPPVQASSDRQDELFLEVSVDQENAFVQGQIILTVRLLTAVNIAQYGINDPQIADLDVVVDQLGEDKQYRSTRGQQEYIVLERNYAIFPQESGVLHIAPIIAQADMIIGSNIRMSFFQRNTRTRRLQSKAIEIKVAGIPPDFHGKIWLPANSLQLIEEWPQNPPEFTAGEPITWTISIGAKGLTAAQLPELAPDDIVGLKQYPDQPILQDQKKDNNIIGLRQEKIALIPPHAGEFTLPAIEIPWWNTQTNKMETARIPARKITVAPGKITAPPQIPAAGRQDESSPAITPQETAGTLPPIVLQAGYWPWLSLFLGAGWILTGMAWIRSKKSSKKDAETAKNAAISFRKARNNLKKACGRNDAPAVKDALLAWGKCLFPQTPPHNLGELGKLTDEPLKSELNLLNSALYAADVQDYNGTRLWTLARKFALQNTKAGHHNSNTLEPMNR